MESRCPGWSQVCVAGHVCEVFVPEAERLTSAAVLHLRDMDDRPPSQSPAWRVAIEASPLVVLSVPGGATWWIDRIVPHFDRGLSPEHLVIGPVASELARRFEGLRPAVALVGQGSGGQAALRIAYRHPSEFPVAAAVAATVDFHLTMESGQAGGDLLWQVYGDVEPARQATAILHIHPLNWPRHQAFYAHVGDHGTYEAADRLHGKLSALGIPHVAELETRGDWSTWMAGAVDRAVRFAVERLAADSRRIA